jgi:hypothetical protein
VLGSRLSGATIRTFKHNGECVTTRVSLFCTSQNNASVVDNVGIIKQAIAITSSVEETSCFPNPELHSRDIAVIHC